MLNTRIFYSRKFVVWRYIYTVVLVLLAAPFLVKENREVGSGPGVALMIYGVLPSIAYLVASKLRWSRAPIIAYAHDSFLVLCGIILLIVLSNYFCFVFMSPLAGFVAEWIIATYCMLVARRDA